MSAGSPWSPIGDPASRRSSPINTVARRARRGAAGGDEQGGASASQAQLQQAEADFDPLPFDAEAARAFGQVAASLRRSGRKTRARAFDAMIAATAVANDLPLFTCNPDDFRGIASLDVRAVPPPGISG